MMQVSNDVILSFFFFNDTATTEIYTLSLHDALPIYSADEKRIKRAQEKTIKRNKENSKSLASSSLTRFTFLRHTDNLLIQRLYHLFLKHTFFFFVIYTLNKVQYNLPTYIHIYSFSVYGNKK